MDVERVRTDARCGECGTPLRGMPLDDVPGLELDFQGQSRDEAFCSQEHAAAWLAKPLPPVGSPGSPPGAATTLTDWLIGGALVTAAVSVLALAAFGAITLLMKMG